MIFCLENHEEKIEETKAFIDTMINESVGLVVSRQLFSDLLNGIMTKLSVEDTKQIAQYALDKIQPRAISFEDQVSFKILEGCLKEKMSRTLGFSMVSCHLLSV
jgi:COP9 signalosome complex subunit 4